MFEHIKTYVIKHNTFPTHVNYNGVIYGWISIDSMLTPDQHVELCNIIVDGHW